MKYRKLGKNGPTVSALGLGCMGMSQFYGDTNQEMAVATIHKAYENGITFFDTADLYGNGENEKLLGKAIAPFREKIIIGTKCGTENGEKGYATNNKPDYVKQACDASLKRLAINTIDIYYLNRHDVNVPIEEPMYAMCDLIKTGKIRFVGLCEMSPEIIERAHKILGDKLVAVQTEYSILNRVQAEIVLPTCKKLGIAFVPYSPMGRGLLTGKIKSPQDFNDSTEFDFRSVLPQFHADNLSHNLRLANSLEESGKKKNCSAAQLALAWLLAQGDDIIPIPGTKRIKYLLENIASLEVTLSADDLLEIEKASKINPIKGRRLPDELMNMFNLNV